MDYLAERTQITRSCTTGSSIGGIGAAVPNGGSCLISGWCGLQPSQFLGWPAFCSGWTGSLSGAQFVPVLWEEVGFWQLDDIDAPGLGADAHAGVTGDQRYRPSGGLVEQLAAVQDLLVIGDSAQMTSLIGQHFDGDILAQMGVAVGRGGRHTPVDQREELLELLPPARISSHPIHRSQR